MLFIHTAQLSFDQLHLLPEAICQLLDRKHPDADLLTIVQEMRPLALETLNGFYALKVLPITNPSPRIIVIDNTYSFRDDSCSFRDAVAIAFILLTLGKAVEREIKRLYINGFFLEGTILDAYANAALNNLTQHAQRELALKCSELKLKPSCRLLPSTDLDQENQRTVHAVLAEEIAAVNVIIEENFISPEKTHIYLMPIYSIDSSQ